MNSREKRIVDRADAQQTDDVERETSANDAGDRRAVLSEIARWATLAPAMAVLFDPEKAHADLSPGPGD